MPLLTAHQSAALDFKNHISLTANAGSGKTFVLSMRYLEIALTENIPLRSIAAITFTDKAASELYKKIAQQVDEKLDENNEPQEIRKLESIRRQLVSANISTIHSFCIDILREHPVEAGLDANFIPIDERLANELIELSVEELIKSALHNPEETEDLKYLIRIFASKRLFARELISLIKNRKNVLSLASDLYTKSNEEIADYYFSTFIKLFEELFFNDKNKIISELTEINNTVLSDKNGSMKALTINGLIRSLEKEKDFLNALKIIFDIKRALITGKGTIAVAGYLKREARQAIEKICDNVECYFRQLPEVELSDHCSIELELAIFGIKIIHFFNRALKIYSGKKNENSYLDYEDILLFTQKILENDDVRQLLFQKYKFIMIDEYQDTNEIQYQIFLPILDYLKRGNLFVVGDEKQSIYMFRDAELEIFNRTKNDIKLKSGEDKLLNLPDSFRMAPELCVFTNYIFRNLFSNPVLLFNEVEHSDLVCARTDEAEGKVEILLAIENEDNKISEADLVSSRLLNLKKENINVSWNDIAVLCRKRKSFTELEASFIKNEIPFAIVGGKGFYQRQVIYDIYNYFSFLLDEGNDAALAGVLRSPFFTISDSVIYEISNHQGKNFWNKIINSSKKDERYVSVIKSLKENLLLANIINVTSILRKILNESNYLAVLASESNGQQELANIEKLIRLTINFSSQGFTTLYDYVNFLKDSIEDTEDEAQAGMTDESSLIEGHSGKVKIMTIHQAKGLEFPIVVLFNSNEFTRNSRTRSKSIHVNKNFGILTKLPLKQNYFAEYKSAPIIELSNYISDKKNLAEIKRLFYVAVTRAKDQLIISSSAKEGKRFTKDSFMGLLQSALGDAFETEISIDDELKFLGKNDQGYYNYVKEIKLNIPLITEIGEAAVNTGKLLLSYEVKNLRIQQIADKTAGEIISATKVAVYKQCPLKYKLTYEFGYLPIYSNYKKWKSEEKQRQVSYEFNYNETELPEIEDNSNEQRKIKSFSEIKGRIIHLILQKEIQLNVSEDFITAALKAEVNVNDYSRDQIQELKKEIFADIKTFYESKIYSELMSVQDYKNEFEIYVKENDYFLFGIIDKLIKENKKVIIVDYKTDDIPAEEISERAQAYLTQLKFYSYIVSRFFNTLEELEVRLIFIKHPAAPFVKNMKSEDIRLIKTEIEEMVSNVRQNKFSQNFDHCSKCIYSEQFNKCIVK